MIQYHRLKSSTSLEIGHVFVCTADANAEAYHRVFSQETQLTEEEAGKGKNWLVTVLDTKKDKHFFTKHAKHLKEVGLTKHAMHLKEVGLRYDDDLTRLQQSERQDLSADFNILRTKGHKPFYRGSSLKFRHADKMCTCKRNGANAASVAQA